MAKRVSLHQCRFDPALCQNGGKIMNPRCTWTGYLKISLVTVPVRVYTAINSTEKITFNQLHKGCHQRIRQKLVCPVHGEMTREDLVKGYEYSSDKFVTLTETEIEAVRLESTHTIELVQFVRSEELDPVFLDTAYYVGPDGPVSEQAFAVLHQALRRSKRIGIGQVVLGGKEKLIALKPSGKGFVFFTLRYVAEVRPPTAYFESTIRAIVRFCSGRTSAEIDREQIKRPESCNVQGAVSVRASGDYQSESGRDRAGCSASK
jgi:Ku protein